MTSPSHRASSPTRAAGLGARPGDGGFTLIEILVAVVIMGLVFLVVLTGIFAAVRLTDDNRKRVEGDRLARDLAEVVKAGDIGDLYEYVPCGIPNDGDTNVEPREYPEFVPPEPHEDWLVEITRVEYRSPSNPAAWTNSCTATTTAAGFQDDGGAQRITITALPPVTGERSQQTVVVIKRDTRGDGS